MRKPDYETFCYLGVWPCGCVCAATVDDGTTPESTRKDVAEFMRGGLNIERVLVPEARERLFKCVCDPKAEDCKCREKFRKPKKSKSLELFAKAE